MKSVLKLLAVQCSFPPSFLPHGFFKNAGLEDPPFEFSYYSVTLRSRYDPRQGLKTAERSGAQKVTQVTLSEGRAEQEIRGQSGKRNHLNLVSKSS